MWVIERRRAPQPCQGTRPARNETDFRRPQRLLARPRRPVSTSTWPPCGSHSAQHTDRGPIYVSFVSKATLWDRGLCRYTAHTSLDQRPLLCPRFLSHMKACPEDLRPPRYLSTKPRQQPAGQTHRIQALSAPKTRILEDSRSGVQNKCLVRGRCCPVVVPCIPVPPTPMEAIAGSTINPTPPPHNTPHFDSGRRRTSPDIVPASPHFPHPPLEENDVQMREGGQQVALVSTPEPGWEQHLGPDEPRHSVLPISGVSEGSLSGFSRPPSSQFSRSTDLASGRSSVLSADMRETDSEGNTCLSQLRPSSVVLSAPASSSPPGSSTHQSSDPAPPFYQPFSGQTKPLTPDLTSVTHSRANGPLSDSTHSKTTEHLHHDAAKDLGLDPSDHGLVALASPSATWSSCPSLQRTTPRSGSGAKLTPSPVAGRQEWTSQRWPVLPPISPVRGGSGAVASCSSELSCSHSQMFDELEAIAPRSPSCLSLVQPLSSPGCPSPDTELSPGLAALTVGCDSGNLGSLSRVQLLLLGRPEPETFLNPPDLEDFSPTLDWPGQRMQYSPGWTSAGVLRPLTAGSISERCNFAGKVQGGKPAHSEEDSGSPSSWIIDPSPSDMFRASDSPCKSSHTSCTDEGGPTKEECNYPGWWKQGESSTGGRRPERLECRIKEKDRRMEERKTKVLDMLSKLQDSTPHQPTNQGHSNFEDFDFLAKYCIFSQEKLAEYKRAFEAVDSDGDGYISCLQVVLALKNIIPPELLSEEEEIFVYRILEMVDFRVTDGLTDLRLFAVIASLAQKIATMDEFMRSLITNMDFRSLEVKLFKAKQLFLFLLEEQAGGAVAQQGFISAEQLLVELKAGGIHLEQESAIKLELQHIPSLDLLDFLAYLPLFILIHKSVIANPLDDSSNL